MFNFNAFIKLININGDNIISKEEIENFTKTQSKESVFTNYLNSVETDIGLDTFIRNTEEIAKKTEQNGTELKLYFNSKEDEESYNKLVQQEDAIEKQEREQIKEYFRNRFLWKCTDENEFDQIYDKFLEQVNQNINLLDLFEQLEPKKAMTLDDYLKSGAYGVNMVKALPDIDWSQSKDMFQYLSFTSETFSNTSQEHLPDGYKPDEVIEKGMTIGLGIDKAHKRGYTGKGVSVAICDWQLKKHEDIKTKEYQCMEHAKTIDEFFHASAVTSILAGQKTGIAPDSDVYFFAEQDDYSNRGTSTDLINSFKAILEKNKNLPDNEKIRVISISGPIYGGEEADKLVKELTDSGVWVLSSPEFWKNFAYTSKIDAMGNPDDFNNYQIHCGNPEALFVNAGDRTIASPDSETAYRHDSIASASWAIPVVAGYYALACQADPTMTPERFIRLATETAQIIDSTKPVFSDEYQGNENVIGRSEDTVQIKMIDIDALLTRIEQDKIK